MQDRRENLRATFECVWNRTKYTYDAWDRLVRVEYREGQSSPNRALYTYNGLHWRIRKDADTTSPPDGTVNQRREMYYSAAWRLLHEEVNDDLDQGSSVDRHVQYVWAGRSPHSPHSSDDIIYRRENRDFTNDAPEVTRSSEQ